ncbi:hypothetical protein HYT25_02810 [Candidatus Pacearchaeota archaeon]|nr:hypothetical protein [Candidatus Pacearchaeota archaeon]
MKASTYVIILLILLDSFFGYFVLTGLDIISVTSGGEAGITASSDPFFEGNIPGDLPVTEEEAAPSGGAGGGGIIVPSVEVSPTEFNIELAVNTNIEKTITVKNLKSTVNNVNIRQSNLDNMIIISESLLTLNPGETKSFNVVFVALNRTGIFTGKILIGNKEIPVSINVRTKLLLFDSNIVVLNKNYIVGQGRKLKTEVTLIPLGDENRLDVALNYVIQDYNGKIYLTKSETLLVDKRIDFRRDFDTGILPLGQYIVGLELVYPNGVATSSAHFEVVERVISLGYLVYYLIIAILINMILIVVLFIDRFYKQRRIPTDYSSVNPQFFSEKKI